MPLQHSRAPDAPLRVFPAPLFSITAVPRSLCIARGTGDHGNVSFGNHRGSCCPPPSPRQVGAPYAAEKYRRVPFVLPSAPRFATAMERSERHGVLDALYFLSTDERASECFAQISLRPTSFLSAIDTGMLATRWDLAEHAAKKVRQCTNLANPFDGDHRKIAGKSLSRPPGPPRRHSKLPSKREQSRLSIPGGETG